MILTWEHWRSGSQRFSASWRGVSREPSARFCRDSRRYMYPKIQEKTASINNYLTIHVSRRFSEIYCHLSPNTLKSWTLGGQSPPLCAQQLSKTCLGYARLFTPP